MDYFKQLLDFSVVTLQKLSAPAKEKEMKASYQKLMEELGEVSFSGENLKRSFALLMVRGLRFVLHQIQVHFWLHANIYIFEKHISILWYHILSILLKKL